MKLEVSQFSQKIYDVEILNEDLVNGSEIFIGRSDDCHVVLDDQQISRHHAIFYLQNRKLFVKKLSHFGSMTVNGHEITDAEVKVGDRLTINSYLLQITDLKIQSEISNQNNMSESTSVDVFNEELSSIDVDDTDDNATEIFNTDSEKTDLIDELENTSLEDYSSQTQEDLEDQDLVEDDILDDDQEDISFEQESDSFSSETDFEAETDYAEEVEFGDEQVYSDDIGFEQGDVFQDENAEESTQVFQSFVNYYLKIEGDYAPFDRYTIENGENFIGRNGDECKIVLDDPEVSGIHAVLRKSLINCILEDLNSSNGTILNGERINKAEVINGDIFTIGQTTFTVEITSDLLEAESDMLMPVEDNQVVEVEEIVEEEIDFDQLTEGSEEFGLSADVQEKSFIKRIMKDPRKRIYAIVAILLLFLLLSSEDEEGQKKTAKKSTKTKNTTSQSEGQTGINGGEKNQPTAKQLSSEELEKLEQHYALALAKYEAGEYYEAKEYLEIVKGIDPNYKDTKTLIALVKQGHEELVRLKKEEQAEKERKLRQLKVEQLVTKAKEAVKKREVQVSESLFAQIMELDPENIDVPQMKIEIDAFKKAQEDKKLEEERKIAERKRQVDTLAPGKGLYLKGDWFKAIDRLEKFLNMKGMDEDLIEDATKMLKVSKQKLLAQLNPLLGKARSFKEGQDLKRAYETYGEVLKFDPSNEEALNERDDILQALTSRSRRLYREALISESLSLFQEAREKFQQVQQISPINSEYYNKASEKLKDYLE